MKWRARWLVLLKNRAWADLHWLATSRPRPTTWEVAVFARRAAARRAIAEWPPGMGHRIVRIR